VKTIPTSKNPTYYSPSLEKGRINRTGTNTADKAISEIELKVAKEQFNHLVSIERNDAIQKLPNSV
jgi:hypothetical protein